MGFIFVCFHLVSEGMSVLLLFITFLTWDWKDFVGLTIEIWKLFVCTNSSFLDSYCVVSKITTELPLSAHVIIAPLSLSLVLMLLMAWDSVCAVCVRVCCSSVEC